jgi:hypothetical protein
MNIAIATFTGVFDMRILHSDSLEAEKRKAHVGAQPVGTTKLYLMRHWGTSLRWSSCLTLKPDPEAVTAGRGS